MGREKRKARGLFRLGWIAGAAAFGIGAGVAVERLVVGRERLRADPYAGEPYGKMRGDRSYEVASFDGAVLFADEIGPENATAGAVFLHGYCLNRTIWHHQAADLGDGRRYVFYDARHHGRSAGGRAVPDTRTLARDLKAVLDRSGLQQAVLIGHSMGGAAVLEFCREFPGELGARVSGLILANTTYTDVAKTLVAAEVIGPIERRTRRLIERVLEDPRSSRLLRLREDDLSWMLVRLFGFGAQASPTQVAYIRRLLTVFPSPPLIEMLRGMRAFDMEGSLESIDVPTLVIAGGRDRITTVRASRRLSESIPGARLVVLEDAGHTAMMEREQQFTLLVAGFLNRALAGLEQPGESEGRLLG